MHSATFLRYGVHLLIFILSYIEFGTATALFLNILAGHADACSTLVVYQALNRQLVVLLI